MTLVRPLMVIGSLPLPLQRGCSKVPRSLGGANTLTQSTWRTLEPFPFRLNRNGALSFSFDAFSSREPASTSLENALVPGIERIVQAVTHQIEADHEGNDRKPGPECHPWR